MTARPYGPALEPESWPTGLLTHIAAALDRAALRGMSLAFEAALLPPTDEYPVMRAAARPYAEPALRRNPARFFAGLDHWDLGAPAIDALRAISGGTVTTLRFASGYAPYHGAIPDDDPCRENDDVWVEHWTHVGRPARGTLIALHGFTMGTPAVDARVMMVDRWFALGLDIALVTLPFHGRRASPRCRYSGERFASWDVARLNEAVRQSVYDVQGVSRWLARTSGKPVGVLGVSLGGYVTALLAAFDSDLAFVIPVVPAVCLADLPMRLLAMRRGSSRLAPPFTRAELRRAYRVHSPLVHPLRVPRERVLVVGGRGDAVTPVSQTLRLWRHWGRPAAVWCTGGHVATFRRGQVMAAIESCLCGPRPGPSTAESLPAPAASSLVPLRRTGCHAA